GSCEVHDVERRPTARIGDTRLLDHVEILRVGHTDRERVEAPVTARPARPGQRSAAGLQSYRKVLSIRMHHLATTGHGGVGPAQGWDLTHGPTIQEVRHLLVSSLMVRTQVDPTYADGD